MALDKSYTLQSLRIWLHAYRKQWWDVFPKTVVDKAIRLLNGHVRSFELQPTFLLVQGQIDKNAYFATIDLKTDQTIYIHNFNKDANILAFAAAGLFILEKLLEEHINDLDVTDTTTTQTTFNHSPQRIEKHKFSSTKLVFSKQDQGIFLEIFFQRNGLFQRITSLEQTLRPSERECILTLMLQTQRYGFKWHKNGLLSNSLESFRDLVQKLLPKLSEKYFTEYPQSFDALKATERTISINLKPTQNGLLSQEFLLNGQPIEQQLAQKSLKNKNHTYWSEKHGIIRWQENTISWLNRINDWRNRLPNNELPTYLAWSIFNPQTKSLKPSDIFPQHTENIALPLTDNHLRPYQVYGVQWMKKMLDQHYHPLLADEMGLGKTRQLLALLGLLMQNDNRPSIVICPASVISVWQNEGEKYFPFPVNVLKQENLQNYKPKKQLLITSYSQILHNIAPLKTIDFCCAVLDEAQFIKNPKSKTAYACFNLKASHRVAATGTPLENNFTDVWTLFHFLMPGLLGNFKEFQTFVQNENNCTKLKIQIAPFILRRRQIEVLSELPDKNEHIVYCPMTVQQKTLYESFLQQSVHVKTGQWMQLLTLILRLRQICCFPGLIPGYEHFPINHSGKLTWLLGKLAQTPPNTKVIIFSQFKTLLECLLPSIKNLFPEVYLLTGQTLLQQRRTMIKNFQTTQHKAAFLVSLKAGGTGITLNAANEVFILDPWWNPAIEQQAIARAYRLGQTHTLAVYRLLIENSIESTIQNLKKDKTELFSALFDNPNQLSSQERWQQLYATLFPKNF